MITKFDEYKKVNENITLTDDEKNYLWGKLEYKKKKTAIDNENKLFDLLKGDKNTISSDDFDIVLKSLEYTFRKKLSGQDNPMNSQIFLDLQQKVPKTWFGVSYSSLSARKKQLDNPPKITSSKKSITDFLSRNNIKFDDDMNKTELLKLINDELPRH